MADEGENAAIVVWRMQSVWSQAANALKARVERVRGALLVSGVAGAVLGTAAAQSAETNSAMARGLSLGAALALAAVAFLAQRNGQEEFRDWIRLRAVSEQLKGDLYTYLAGVTPYRAPDAAQRLLDRTMYTIDAIGALGRHTGGLVAVDRPLPAITDVPTYVQKRVRSQIDDYYRPRARTMHGRIRRARWTETALGAVGALLGVIGTTGGIPGASAWVAVLTTLTGTVAAHIAGSRWEFQEIEYQRTAAQLEQLTTRHATISTPTAADDDAFVAECEQVISIENEGWMARWSGPTET